MKIKVGDYVRTKTGIGKIIKIFEYADRHKDYYTDMCIDDEDNSTTLHIHQIVKHSENIIDLIEVKDVVKFRNKLPNSLEDEEMIIHIFNNDTLEEVKEAINSKEIEIVSIVTHQSFKEAEYEV